MIPYNPSKKTADAILAFSRETWGVLNAQWNLREHFRQVDLAYQRETDLTEEQFKAKQALRKGDADKFRNVTMPIIMPKVEAAVTYQQSVFLTGYPMFGVVAPPAHADAATQMDTIIATQQVRGNWVAEFLLALRNGFKYNLGPLEVSWEKEVSYALVEPADSTSTGPTGRDRTDRQTQTLWEGNKVKSLDVYNTFFDTRCAPVDIPSEGEFAGYIELKSRIALKKFLASLPTRVNVKEALESNSSASAAGTGEGSAGTHSYYVPHINPNAMFNTAEVYSTNWMAWAGVSDDRPRINYKNMYEVTTLYGRILPSDFGMTDVPAKNTPQVWKFIIVNNQVVVYAERLTNSHNLIPIFFAQPTEDGLGYQSKSLADNLEPFQQITTALSNSIIAARRRAISDRMLYDPSRVSAGAINNDQPVARIPVRPSAFGTQLSDAVYPIPFRDDQSQYAAQIIQSMNQWANETSGLNPARQGHFVKGNKTRYEFAETMGYANGRDQTIALTLEGNFFAPIKEVIKANILQYQGGVSLYNIEANETIEVDPVALRRAQLEFKISDGLLPSDKLIDGESFNQFLQVVASNPQLAAGYNITPMISYLMKTRGAKLQPFEKTQAQLQYEQAVAIWQQAIATLATQLEKLEQMPPMEQLQQMLPPQPTPEQFGYVPGAPQGMVGDDGTSVYGRYAQVLGQQQAAQQAAPSGTAGMAAMNTGAGGETSGQ